MDEAEKDIIDITANDSFGIPYLFPYQKLVIDNILRATEYYGTEESAEVLGKNIILLPTGYGKSLCFMLPALLLDSLTIVIFPLLSLIADQQRRCEESGISSVAVTGSTSAKEKKEIKKNLAENKYKILLTNPESLTGLVKNDFFKNCEIAHFVVDESHTISEWGDSFRSSLLEIGNLVKSLNPKTTSCFTATASESIISRIQEIVFFNEETYLISANPDRENISYHIVRTIDRYSFLENIADYDIQVPAIIFCRSRTRTEKTAWWLKQYSNFKEIYYYHAGLSTEAKKEVENAFYKSNNGVLVTTCAYGMGVDKKNVRTVIHLGLPETPESFLQESGRGGRDREAAYSYTVIDLSDITKIIRTINKENDHFEKRYLCLSAIMLNDGLFCRRDSLLTTLNANAEKCNTCDICRNEPKGLNVFNLFKIIILLKFLCFFENYKDCLANPRKVKVLNLFTKKYPEEDLASLFNIIRKLKLSHILKAKKKLNKYFIN